MRSSVKRFGVTIGRRSRIAGPTVPIPAGRLNRPRNAGPASPATASATVSPESASRYTTADCTPSSARTLSTMRWATELGSSVSLSARPTAARASAALRRASL